MAQMFGLRPPSRCVNITHDWSSRSQLTTKDSEALQDIVSFVYNSTTFKCYGTSFAGFIPFAKKNLCLPSPYADTAQEHMYFFIYWLNKHIFPNKANRGKPKWIHLVKALHSYDDVATGPFILAYLYYLLYEMTKGLPFETNLNGATWVVQIWL